MVEELDAGAPAKVKIGGSLRPLLSSWCFPWAAFLVAAGRGCLALLPRRLGRVRRVLCARGSLVDFLFAGTLWRFLGLVGLRRGRAWLPGALDSGGAERRRL